MENKDSSIVNHLKRLDRFGNKNSKTIEKLQTSSVAVAKYIIENDLVDLLQDYTVYGSVLSDNNGNPINMKMSIQTVINFAERVIEANILGYEVKKHKGNKGEL